jgi:predicted RNA binding protein YcfA (HicA-like mRNA interferase family)
MSQHEKLRQKIRNHPHGVTFDELDAVLRQCGYELGRISGSHHFYRRKGFPPIIVARHSAHVDRGAVEEVLLIVDELFGEE